MPKGDDNNIKKSMGKITGGKVTAGNTRAGKSVATPTRMHISGKKGN